MSTDLVPFDPDAIGLVTQSGIPIVPEEWGVRQALPPIRTSLELDSDRGRKLLFACMGGEVVAGKDAINTQIEIVDYLIHPVDSVDEDTGEVRKWVRTCLVSPAGAVIAFGSGGILKSLQLLSVQWGKAPWEPPIRATVKVRAIGGGRQWYTLEPVWPEGRNAKAGDKAKKV